MSELSNASGLVLRLLAEVSLRAFAIGVLAAPAAWLAVRRGAELRHAVWLAVLASMLLLPVLTLALPRVYLLPPFSPGAGWTMPEPHLPAPPSSPVAPAFSVRERSLPLAAQPSRTAVWPVLLLAAYLIGASALLLRVVLSVRRTGRILHAARPVRDESLLAAMAEVSLHGRGFPLPPVCESGAVRVPFAAGWLVPTIILPADWREWDGFRLRAVLAHEMEHLRRADWPVSVLAAFNRALFFFHPLAWFLDRRLAALAEEACDTHAMAAATDPRRYAAVLFDFAAQLPHRAVPATAMARSSKVGARIERLLARDLPAPRPLNALAWSLLAALSLPLLYAAASVDPGQAPAPEPTIQRQAESPIPRNSIPGANLTAQEAAELEQRLAKDPHDLDTRGRLIGYYYSNAYLAPWLQHLQWAIDHHPEAALHETYPGRIAADRRMVPDDAIYRGIQELWRCKAVENPSNVEVLLHAAGFFSDIDRAESRRLYEAARLAAPEDPRPLGALSGMWMADLRLLIGGPPEADQRASEALEEFLRGNDAQLIGGVGLQVRPKNLDLLVTPNARAHGGSEAFQSWWEKMHRRRWNACERLLARAAELDPANPKWREALRQLRAPAQPAAASAQPEKPRRISVGGGVQERMLVEAPAPKYPPLALQAQITGAVRFTVVIGPEGDVTNVTLISGHPLLVQAATEAVQRYRYRPTLLNGQPVEVVTTISVPFDLPYR